MELERVRLNALNGLKNLSKRAVGEGAVSVRDLEAAVDQELAADMTKGLSPASLDLLDRLSRSSDADLLPVIQKLLKSTRLVVQTHLGGEPPTYSDEPLFPPLQSDHKRNR